MKIYKSLTWVAHCSNINPCTSKLVCNRLPGHKGDHSGSAILYPEHTSYVSQHWWINEKVNL